MGFSDEVAEILARLTTKDGGLPQGAVTSSFLANLIFWNYEPGLVERLNANGLTYSRYVDDISVSSRQRLPVKAQSRLVSDVFGMLLHHGFQPKRAKHEVFTARKAMRTTKLLNNRRVALTPAQRQNIRSAVYSIERQVAAGERSGDIEKELARVASRVGRLGGFHAKEGLALKLRLKVVRLTLEATPSQIIDQVPQRVGTATTDTHKLPPWEE
ncbi:hypothetical protein RugamoR1_57020 [Rugamonas sp. R1(2021)]